MQIRHLRNSKIITEILILCVAYISMAAGVYIGIAGNDTSKAYYSLIVIIPAIVTYFSRKYIKSYPLPGAYSDINLQCCSYAGG